MSGLRSDPLVLCYLVIFLISSLILLLLTWAVLFNLVSLKICLQVRILIWRLTIKRHNVCFQLSYFLFKFILRKARLLMLSRVELLLFCKSVYGQLMFKNFKDFSFPRICVILGCLDWILIRNWKLKRCHFMPILFWVHSEVSAKLLD